MNTLVTMAARILRRCASTETVGAGNWGLAVEISIFCTVPARGDEHLVDRGFSRQRGFTLAELMVVVFIIGLLSAIAASKIIGTLDKARLARCQTELRYIQEEVWDAYAENGTPIDPSTYWQTKWNGRKPGPYYYLVDDDAGVDFGFDLDGINEKTSPADGNSGNQRDIKFVVLCQHDHKDLADYVYIEDHGPPTFAKDDNQPGYDRFVD